MVTARDQSGLEKAAAESVWLVRLVGFTRWVANSPRTGRKLTQTGRLTMADARMLVERLGTGDVGDPVIGDRTFRTKSSEELRGLFVVLEWARAVGLVRRRGNYLVAVKKRAGLPDRPLELLARMVEVLGELGPAVCPSGWGRSIPYDDFVTGVEALLTAMDVDPNALTPERLPTTCGQRCLRCTVRRISPTSSWTGGGAACIATSGSPSSCSPRRGCSPWTRPWTVRSGGPAWCR